MRAFTLVELTVSVAIVTVLSALTFVGGQSVYREASLAISANNIRSLSAGASAYLNENRQVFWPYRSSDPSRPPGVTWWFGYETEQSLVSGEGQRRFDPDAGPLAGYVPASIRPDPSLALGGRALKPKYAFGYIGIAYNVGLGGDWTGTKELKKSGDLSDPSRVVVFSTSAQVNTFQRPASPRNPMIEEFYGIDQRERTVHFRHHGYAMVAFASGSAGFLPIDPSTRDARAPSANIGRFAPVGSTLYLE